MSTRERWIVYPLLFLALGTAIKPKLMQRELRASNLPSTILRAGRVECGELSILGGDNRPRVIARTGASGGVIHLIDNQGNVVAIQAETRRRAGLIEEWFAPFSESKPD
ncbi:MAG: hypothetical protein WD894_20845 [Pirellulales bacterium]